MSESKRFKDPIYGYIKIPNYLIENVVDTAEFQRLRNVTQTNYSPLYSSAVHNRFVHSLGVYHLGKLLSKNIIRTLPEELTREPYNRFFSVFKLACLLHDIGHAPFSHVGEEFYLGDGTRDNLHDQIVDLTDDDVLKKEIEYSNSTHMASPHELMSAIVGLKKYASLFQDKEEKSFFARCITGYEYVLEKDSKFIFLNCLISFLNSSIIDIDKLDYLIRDAYITGFDTINIDYKRLLKNIQIVEGSGQDRVRYQIVYSKGALSVIENVVYAHDAERKWIQNHPVVQYESYLLKNAITSLNDKYSDKNLFSYDSLMTDGIELTSEYKACLLSDADIIFLMKNLDNNESVNEYFNRNTRRHPLWKSESEYKAIFDTCFCDQTYAVLDEEMKGLFQYLNFLNNSQMINSEALKACCQDIKECKNIYNSLPCQDEKAKEKYQDTLIQKERFKQWMIAFKTFSEDQGIDFDFVILNQKQFNSGFAKPKFSELKILLPESRKLSEFKDVTNVLEAKESFREKFFYVFYKREINGKKDISVFSLVNQLNDLAKQETMC